ncbi:MAG: glycosyltransferase [Burkholderiales bacterium]|nr:glycosyltransferase [Burkholderiales bacterium]MDE2397021.1 glycosyltransferase [Burkholderiales bacterium]MDE2454572.1 glycosyltransferase [Burkholderiales bacterium]
MLRVLHLGKFYPPDNGGIESVTAALARGAAAAGMATTVLCFEELGRGDAQDGPVTVRRVRAIKIASQPLCHAYLRQATRLAREADIVHVHLPNMLAAWAVTQIGAGPRVVLHWHSDVVGKGVLAHLSRPLERAMLRRADKVICTSQAYADASLPLRPFAAKVVVVPIGVAEPEAPVRNGAAVTPSGLPTRLQSHLEGRPLVLAVGRLVPYKGFAVLIDAAARLETDAAVVIVGGGPMQAELHRRIEAAGVDQRVMLAGRVDEATLAVLLRQASLFCMPSIERSEAFGVALVEALARGLAVVATRIPGSGVPWVNSDGETGINVEPGQPEALAQAIDCLLRDSGLRERMGQGARKRYEDHFTLERSTQAVLTLYRKLTTIDGS